jgi:hypothetical protein
LPQQRNFALEQREYLPLRDTRGERWEGVGTSDPGCEREFTLWGNRYDHKENAVPDVGRAVGWICSRISGSCKYLYASHNEHNPRHFGRASAGHDRKLGDKLLRVCATSKD